MAININNSVCDQCGTCISVCPGDALVLTDSLEWKEQRCSLCTQCVRICPFGAISSSSRSEEKNSLTSPCSDSSHL